MELRTVNCQFSIKTQGGLCLELLIKNAKVLDSDESFCGDVYIKDGIISNIGNNISKNCKVIYANGLTLMPAFVDLHTHFRDPGYTYKEDIITGSRAAVRGGYTTVNLMPNTNPPCSSEEVLEYVDQKTRGINLVDVNQTVSITRNIEGLDISHLDEINRTIKFISDDGHGVQDSKVMLEAMNKAKEKEITIIAHEENDDIKNKDTRLAENLMTWRDIALCKVTKCRLHVTHASTKEAIKYIIEAKKEGVHVTCDVTPHHLTLTENKNYNVNPPLRKQEDINFLINAIKQSYIDCIATDHAPHSKEDKLKGANGISGIETAFSVCYTKLVKENNISLNKLVELMSKRPAEIMGINKGRIKIGYLADLVLVNTDEEYIIKSDNFESKGKNTPFEGMKVYGKIIMTIKQGREVFNSQLNK